LRRSFLLMELRFRHGLKLASSSLKQGLRPPASDLLRCAGTGS
jgi:hypothetical protein